MIYLAKGLASHDTVAALKMLLAKAEKGELVGLYFVGYLKRKRQIWGSTGVAYDDPTQSLGPALLPVMEMAMKAMGNPKE